MSMPCCFAQIWLGLKLVDWTKIPLAFIGDFVVGLIFFELANLFSSTLD